MTDVEQIRQLGAKYNLAFDSGDFDAWLATFTDDAVFERSNADRPYRGKTELAELSETFTVKGRHVCSGEIIEVTGDTATQTCYLQYFDRGNGHTLMMFGVYRDILRRVDGQWLFAERNLIVD